MLGDLARVKSYVLAIPRFSPVEIRARLDGLEAWADSHIEQMLAETPDIAVRQACQDLVTAMLQEARLAFDIHEV